MDRQYGQTVRSGLGPTHDQDPGEAGGCAGDTHRKPLTLSHAHFPAGRSFRALAPTPGPPRRQPHTSPRPHWFNVNPHVPTPAPILDTLAPSPTLYPPTPLTNTLTPPLTPSPQAVTHRRLGRPGPRRHALAQPPRRHPRRGPRPCQRPPWTVHGSTPREKSHMIKCANAHC